MLFSAQPLFASDNYNAGGDNASVVVSYDNNSVSYADNVSSGSDCAESYDSGYYPVGVSNGIDVSKEINNQLEGSGLIFLPNSTGNAVPVEENGENCNNQNNIDGYKIYNKQKGAGK